MKRVLLAVVLLAAVVTVSYLRFWRTSERSAEAYRAGRAGSEAELTEFQARLDSLKYLLAVQVDSIVGSQSVERNDNLCTIDSLIWLLDSATTPSGSDSNSLEKTAAMQPGLDGGSAAISEQTTASRPDSTSVRTAPADTALCRAAMDYYRRLESELPSDLSRYERKVAAYEISVKTTREFSISLAELKAIREMYDTSD